VKIAVIDNALDISHEDLKGAVTKVYDIATDSDDVCPFSDALNHGTEVTGVIAANSNDKGISGIAPEADIFFIRLPFDEDGSGKGITNSDIIEAFDKAYKWGADVINCSWGTGDVDTAVEQAIKYVAKNGRNGRGTVIVFAAGNGGRDKIGDPIGNDESSIEEVIAVGATNIENKRTEYSNYGPTLDIMAPGGEYIGITTLDQMGTAGSAPGDSNYLLYYNDDAFAGTSASAPIVSAVVAQMLQADPGLTREEIYDLLTQNAEKFDQTGCNYDITGFSDTCGYGKVDVTATLNEILN
jgi:subtilisin family serine protease